MGTGARSYRVSDQIERFFPNLLSSSYRITSQATATYNCIAWAAEDQTAWWWPDADGSYYWPVNVVRDETMKAFIAAYATLGYQPCSSFLQEQGYDKIAIYADDAGTPTHAARLLPTDQWTSKLGELEDIAHSTLEGLGGNVYGTPKQALRRPLQWIDEKCTPVISGKLGHD